MGKRKILVVEDDKKIAELLSDYLEQANFNVSILKRGDTVISEVRLNPPDVILLDIMLPGKDGMTICREIKPFSTVPILMLTARVEEIDRLLGLELGADDYICKPFSPREVVARVNAVLRRTYAPQTGKMITACGITLIHESRRVLAAGGELKLTPCEYNLLQTFLTHPNRILSRNELINTVQGYDFEGYDRTIDSHVKN